MPDFHENDWPSILLLGSGPTSLSALKALLEQFHVAGLVRECDPAHASQDETIRLAKARNVPVHLDGSLENIEALVDRHAPACVVVSSHSRLLPATLLDKVKCVNVHYALLPEYRGRANVNWAILNGEPTAAISIHYVDVGLDSGRLLFQREVAIRDNETVATLYDRLNEIQRLELAGTVTRAIQDDPGVPQSVRPPTYCCTRIPEDGLIDWSDSNQLIDRTIRALVKPYPGAFTYYDGARLTIWRASPVLDAPRYVGRIPGRPVAISRREGTVDVLTGDGLLRLFEVQREGEPPVPASRIIRTTRATLGLRMSDLLARIEQLEKLVATDLRSASPS